ncbi:MAG: DUF4157 domain-containing protein [Bacteroidetes bacterium]|nr:DUF4157 domain-containing protein [Bacteroidota bacterium]
MVDNRSDEAIQSKNINKSGISEDTKAVFEQLSGHSFDDVRVHYNSDKPNKIGAYGYARGTNVYLAPGQNRHLHHELWHVAQQKAGRVKANLSFNKLPVNYDVNLEREADQMGDLAMKTIQKFRLCIRGMVFGHQVIKEIWTDKELKVFVEQMEILPDSDLVRKIYTEPLRHGLEAEVGQHLCNMVIVRKTNEMQLFQ